MQATAAHMHELEELKRLCGDAASPAPAIDVEVPGFAARADKGDAQGANGDGRVVKWQSDASHLSAAPAGEEDASQAKPARESPRAGAEQAEPAAADVPELLAFWRRREDTITGMSLSSSFMSLERTVSMHFGDMADSQRADRHCAGCLPTATGRLLWDVFSLLTIVWDLLVLPLTVFNIEEVHFVQVAGLFTTSFWIADIFASFATGFYREDGLIETRFPKIARRYISTWFGLDITLVVIDIMSRLWFAGGVLGRLGKLWRFARVMKSLRMLRLVRARKFVAVFDSLADATLSKPLATGMTILRLLGEVAFAAHFIACAWCAVGRIHGIDAGWSRPFVDTSPGLQYLVAFHWTIAQFTPAPTNVHAVTFEERLFSTVVLFIGIIVFSSLIGRVTALLTKRNQEVAEHMRESERLRSLCSDRGIRLHLAKRVMQFISSPRRRIVWVTEDDVACLKTMPRSLLIELRHGMYSKVLSPHALFRLLGDACHALMLEVCNSAVKETTTDVGDTVFRCFAPGAGMYFVVHGSFDYREGELFLQVGGSGDSQTLLSRGEWLSEAALWCQWEHRGLLASVTPGSIALVHADAFRLAVGAHRSSLHLVRRYAGHFSRRMKAASLEDAVTDVRDAFGEDDLSGVLLEPAGVAKPAGFAKPAGQAPAPAKQGRRIIATL